MNFDGGRRHHAVIAGTGRAGTSFLVQYLSACGLETTVDVKPGSSSRARAGQEHYLLSAQRLPYVVKDPWLSTYCNAVDPTGIAIDALILPMRDLTVAASSRVFQERMAILDTTWRDRPPTAVSGKTPGGVIFSLEVTDQARLLAVGFYDLVFWAVQARIPMFFLQFPRLVQDEEYLRQTLWPWLGAHCAPERAERSFHEIADATLVRHQTADGFSSTTDQWDLDRRALVALVEEKAAALAETIAAQAAVNEALTAARADLDRARADMAASQAALAEGSSWRTSWAARKFRGARRHLR